MATVMKPGTVANDDHVRAAVSDEEWAIRVDLAAAYRLVALYGWDDLIFTHLSARVPGPEHHFLINPYDMMFEEITASSLVKIDVEGQPVVPTSHPVNPAGFVIHSAVHRGRADANCVMHTHTLAGMAIAAQQGTLLPLNQMMMELIGRVALHDYEGVATEENLSERERLVRDLGDKPAMILRHHGLLTDDIRLQVSTEAGVAHLQLHENCPRGALQEFAVVSVLRNALGKITTDSSETALIPVARLR